MAEVIEKKNAKNRITLERGRESIFLKTRKNETCKKVGLLREAKNRNLKENLCGKMGFILGIFGMEIMPRCRSP